MFRYRHLLALICALFIGASAGSCSKPGSQKSDEPTEQAETTSRPSPRPDDGPTVEREAGRIGYVETLEKDAAVVAATQSVDGHFYMAVPLPESLRDTRGAHVIDIDAPTHGIAVFADGDDTLENAIVVTRFVGEKPVEGPIDLTIYPLEGGDRFGMASSSVDKTQTLTIANPSRVEVPESLLDEDGEPLFCLDPKTGEPCDKPEGKLTLERLFADGAADFFESRQPNSRSMPFYAVAEARMRARTVEAMTVENQEGPQTDVAREMSSLSALTAVRETLRAHQRVTADAEGSERTIPLGDVEPVDLEDHDWSELIEELDSQPKLDRLSGHIPSDVAYARFKDIRDLVRLVDELDIWVTPVARAMETSPGASHFASRYVEQLGVVRTELSKHFGNLAAESIGLVVGGPYLREGTDVSLVFYKPDDQVLGSALSAFESTLRERHSELDKTSYDIDGHTVELLTSPDGRVRQHRLKLGDVWILSNSSGAIQDFVDVHNGARESLADGGDYKYMRALYPADDGESGFVFMGDDFLRHVTGPRFKILESRRKLARAELHVVASSVMLYGWLEGRMPRSLTEVVEAGLLEESELQHNDGEKILWSPSAGPHSKWGSLGFMTPLADLEIDKVSQREVDGYDGFRRQYQRSWGEFIDPIGVTVTRSETGRKLELDGRIFPLSVTSQYNDIAELAGDRVVREPEVFHAAQWTFAIGDDAELRKMADQMAQQMTGNRDIGLTWLGGWAMVGMDDRSGIWDMGLMSNVVPDARGVAGSNDAMMALLDRFPIYAGFHVKSRTALAATLTGLRSYIDASAPGLLAWEQTEPYREVAITSISQNSAQGAEPDFPFSLHYAVPGNVLVFAFERATMEERIDAVLDGRVATSPKAGGADDSEGSQTADADSAAEDPAGDAWEQSIFTYRPLARSSWLTQTLLGVLERGALFVHDSVIASYETLVRGLPGLELRDSEAGYRHIALRYLGVVPRNMHGKHPRLDEKTGLVTDPLYGSKVSRTLPPIPVEDSPVARALLALDEFEAAFALEEHGESRGLRVRLRWDTLK
jgi:hypothetical protein